MNSGKKSKTEGLLSRRRVLQLAGVGGASLCLSPHIGRVRANDGTYTGVHWVQINALGGWDPIFLCDPSDNEAFNDLSRSTGTAGNIRYADIPLIEAGDPRLGPEDLNYLMSNRDFFSKYGEDLLVINGVNTETTNHETGQRVSSCGRVAGRLPVFTALAAADLAPGVPLQFLSASRYEATGGLVPLSRIASVGDLESVLFPDAVNTGEVLAGGEPETLFAPSIHDRIRVAQRARTAARRDASSLPYEKRILDELLKARAAATNLQRLRLQSTNANIPRTRLGDLSRLRAQMQFAISAFRAGLACSANLSLGGFDTHNDHNRNHPLSMAKLLGAIDYLLEEATQAGIRDRIGVLVSSDFGRTPKYNGGNGKDHWEVTSMMVLGPGIRGNRVIGATDAERKALPIDPQTPEQMGDEANGIVLTPAHVHRALRAHAGLDPALTARFRLPGETMALL